MSIAIIDINDCGLCCANEQGERVVSPGYALLTAQGITTGHPALKKAYLEPQQSFNQYWRQLNLSPLASPSDKARHHADLAYAQLLDIHRESGSPEQAIFATPGNFDREQLSIILGLAKASPFQTLGLVDSAVAAASQSRIHPTIDGDLLHLDIQLHQFILTRLTVGNQIERTKVDVIADFGLKTFYDNWARYIADLFIQQYRYDPLHTAMGEQQLYDLLPTWLEQLNGDQEFGISLDSPQGSYRLNINPGSLLGSTRTRLDQLQQRLTSLLLDGDKLITSHRANLLPGLKQHIQPFQQLPEDAVVQGCLDNLDTIAGKASDMDNIHFITQLPNRHSDQQTSAVSTDEETAGGENNPPPSHVLYRHSAVAIGEKLFIQQGSDGLQLSQQHPSDTALVNENGALYLRSEQPEIAENNPPKPLQVGDTIYIGAESLRLIEVLE